MWDISGISAPLFSSQLLLVLCLRVPPCVQLKTNLGSHSGTSPARLPALLCFAPSFPASLAVLNSDICLFSEANPFFQILLYPVMPMQTRESPERKTHWNYCSSFKGCSFLIPSSCSSGTSNSCFSHLSRILIVYSMSVSLT